MTATAAPRPASTPDNVPARSHVREAVVIAVAFAIANFALLVRVHNEAEDNLGYLANIRGGVASEIFNPYHLVHHWLGWIAFRLADGLGYDGGPLVPVQVMNAVFGAAGIGVLWLLMRTAASGRLAPVAATGIVALSYGYWAYSLGGDVYAFSAMTLIIALFAAYRAVREPSVANFALLGLASGAAVLAHNTNVLFGLVGLAALVIATREPSRLVRYGASYAAAVIVAVVPLYLVALATVDANTPSEANDWLTAYAQSGDWGVVGPQSLPKAFVGAGRALVGGHFAFALEDVTSLADRASGDQSLREEIFLVRNYPAPIAVLMFVPVAIVAVALVVLAAQWLRRPQLDERTRVLALLALAWLVPYALFVAWWEPVNPEFWIALWVPAAILVALPLAHVSDRERPMALVVGALLASLLIVNLGNIAPQLSEDNDYWRERIAWYEDNAAADDLIVANGFIQTEYLRYFTPARVLNVDDWDTVPPDVAVDEIEAEIAASDASRVLISREAFFPASDSYSECEPGERPCLDVVGPLRDRLQPDAAPVYESKLETVWQLEQ